MSYSNCLIAIKGNHIEKASEIFGCFGFIDTQNDHAFKSIISAIQYIDQNFKRQIKQYISLRAIWYDNDWTIIYDPEGIDALEDEAIAKICNSFNTEVLTFTVLNSGGYYAFGKVSKNLTRRFSVIDENVEVDTGEPLPEETGLNISSTISETDIAALALRFNIDLEMNGQSPAIVKAFAYGDELKEKLAPFLQSVKSAHEVPAKKWWKFW